MNTRRDWSSRLIVISKLMIGLVAAVGLAAFVSLNPYLLTLFSFAQVFLAAGVVLFVVAVITHRRESRESVAEDLAQSQERLYVVKGGRQSVVRDHFNGRREADDRATLGADTILGQASPAREKSRR